MARSRVLFLSTLLSMCVLATVLVFATSQCAWAEDGGSVSSSSNNEQASSVFLDEEKNEVNENQMPDTSFIYDSSIEELASADSYFDKQVVQVVGEATGDIISDEFGTGYCWVVLWEEGTAKSSATNTGGATNASNATNIRVTNTLTVHMSEKDAALIDTLGSYGRKGTTLQVRGVFNLVCDEHNGVSDLHATHVAVTKRGSAVAHEGGLELFVPGILLLALAGALFFLFRRVREKRR